MIGVRKNSGVIRLLMAAALVLFVAACSSSSDNSGLERERDQALEMVEELEGENVDLTASVEDLMGQLAALQGTDAAQEKIDMLEARIAELEEAKEQVDADKAKVDRASVLSLFKGLAPANNPPGATAFDAINWERDVTHGKATKVTASGLTPASVPVNSKLATATGELSDAHGPWSSTLVSAKDGKDTDTVVVFTDIAPDESLPFATAVGATNLTAGLLPAANMKSKYVAAEDLPTDVGLTVHGKETANQAETITYIGTYAGASGVYTCTESGGNSCESRGANGGVQLTGAWNFDPDGGEKALKADAEYAYFGWWWRVDSVGDYSVDVFHGYDVATEVPVDKTRFDSLTGTATYVGPAAGKFAINPQLPDTTPMGGHFTATATLTANLQKPNAVDGGRISGSIRDFMQDDLELPFIVSFPEVAIDIDGTDFDFGRDSTDATTMRATGAVWMIDGEKSSSVGMWEGNFHNQGRDDVPTTMTGEFATTYNDEVGRIEGAFGATVQE